MQRRHLALALLAAFIVVATGCYESLTDIATPDKVVFYEDLLGDYTAADPSAGRLTIEKGKDNSYAYRSYDEKGTEVNRGTLWVLKLGEEHFYQVSVDGYVTAGAKPLYVVGRLRIEGAPGAKTLTGYAFKSEDVLFGDGLVKTDEYERQEGGERKTARALSMPPEKLQAYLAARGAEMTEPVLKFQQTAVGR